MADENTVGSDLYGSWELMKLERLSFPEFTNEGQAEFLMIKLKKPILYTITIAGLLIIFVVFANYMSMVSKGTNVAFQSSGGQWSSREVLMKGHLFEHIVVSFEACKIECGAQNETLQRITKKPSWYSPRHYYNNYQDPKWLVPYAAAYGHKKSDRYPDHCAHGGSSKEIWSEAEKRAQSYISNLSSLSNSP
ncbi:MAG: hypothetical protein OET21_08000 [Desulfobacterales bacterium]|nr:hypothetical protein [Desulfobacterales bacterium]MDH3827342.1 hypothetical protein [Desulfobacterales bacterium]